MSLCGPGCPDRPHYSALSVLQFRQMRNTITVRLPDDLAQWLQATAEKSGIPQGRIIREQLEKVRKEGKQPFLRLAGAVSGPSDLSRRKGFSGR